MKIFISLLALLFAVNLANAQLKSVAAVTLLDGKGEVKEGNEGTPQPLRKNENLFAGQRVRCDGGKGCRKLEVSFCKNIPAKIIKSKWDRIIYIPCDAFGGRIYGDERSDEDVIIYPKALETLRLQNFSVRWKPLGTSVKIDLTLKIDLGKEIYSVKGINGSKGFYQCADMLENLKEAQAAGKFSFNVILTEHGENKTKIRNPQSVNFLLLSLDKEKSLNAELESFSDETDEAFKLIGQALVLGSYELYTESAQEMEKVLSLPQILKMNGNEDLSKILTLAVTANYKAGNTERTKDLCRKLTDSGYSLPEPACSE